MPPNEASRIARFQWVAPGFDQFRAIAETLDQCIIAGHRYAEVDRPEIDRLLDYLSPHTRVVVANRTPPPDLIEAARERGHVVVAWQPGPDFSEVGARVINLGALNRRRRATPSQVDRASSAQPAMQGPVAVNVGKGSAHFRDVRFSGFPGGAIKADAGATITLDDVTVD